MTRSNSKIDTFDVIESSLPGDAADPWNREAADALSNIYGSGEAMFGAAPLATDSAGSSAMSFSSAMPPGASSAAGSGIDHAWLQSRFDEITARIESSIADIRPDQSFFALTQRLEQFERQFNSAADQVATRSDVEGIRLIEAHITEIVEHLEVTHSQLTRLDTIEHQLAAIAGKINEVHQIASASDGQPVSSGEGPAFDIHAVAKAAADEAASRFAELEPRVQPGAGFEEVRGLIERLMSETRQGDENTGALLDTLQQAMIRLLDRVDAIELNQHQAAAAPSAQQNFANDELHVNPDHYRPQSFSAAKGGEALDAAVAAVASTRGNSQPSDSEPAGRTQTTAGLRAPVSEPGEPRQPERIRQDFIADARRAKMRLSAENSAPDVVINKPEAVKKAAAGKAQAAAAKAAPVKEKKESQALLSPRLMAVAIAALMAGGLYLVLPSGQDGPATTIKPLAAPAGNGASKAPHKAKNAAASPSGNASDAQAPAASDDAPAPNSDGAPDTHKPDNETHGEIDPSGDITVGMTTLPLSGVAVDAEKTMSVAELQRAKRQQSMAAMSGKLGQAAAEGNGLAFPAAVDPVKDADLLAKAGGRTALSKGGMSESAALDMPPPTVGPLSLRLAAANGDPSAEFEVGARLAEGKGTDQSFKDAAKWYQRSASKGFVQAQYRLGTLYERGLGMKPDLPRAEDWYKRAAELGNVKAMHNLAVLSTNPAKGTPDYATAAKWFGEAAEHGLSDSQFNLAVLHENGLGAPQDLKLAYKWLSLASRSGDKEAVRRRDILKGKLSADDLAAAENMVSMFHNKHADPMANDARTAGEAWKKNPSNGVNG